MNNRFAFLPMRLANDLLGDLDALRAQMASDGYLYFRQVLDRDHLRMVRRAILSTTQALGWTEPGRIPMSQRCIIAPLREEDDEFIEGYKEIQRLQPFHELAHDPALVAIMRSLLGDTAFPHPLKIARFAFPDNFESSTPPHQDFPNNQGTPELTAAWIPLCDMPPAMGGLAVLRGSHRWGLLDQQRHLGAGNSTAVVPADMDEECRWMTTDFAMGDVLLFPSLAVHAALHNTSEFFVRLSVDFRYQLEGQTLTPGCLQPHFAQLTWEEIYEGWDSDEHQYYWRDLDYEVVPFAPLSVEGGGGRPFTKADFTEIIDYEARVKSRTIRRLRRLGVESEPRARRSTSFERHQGPVGS